MKASVTLATTTTPDGAKLALHAHDGQFSLRVGGKQLMSTTATASEMRLAELGCVKLGAGARAHVLIGGLGFGFTLRRVLELAPPEAKVQVAELLPAIVDWNREHLRAVNGALIEEPRVEIVVDDVLAVLSRAAPGHYDVVLLDVDNGPNALVDHGNAPLYDRKGLRVLSNALRRGGRAVFWSASTDDSFVERLAAAGFKAEAVGAKAYAQAKRDTHTLFVADKRG